MNLLDRRIALWSIAAALLALGTIVAVWPEPPARALTANEGWTITRGSRAADAGPLSANPQSYLRRSVLASVSSLVFRSWTPDRGLQQFEAISPPVTAASVMSVVVTGTTRTADGGHRAFFTCSAHPQQIDVFLGSVNVTGRCARHAPSTLSPSRRSL